MTHDQYFRIRQAIASCHDSGRLPHGCQSVSDFTELESMFNAYLSHAKRATVVGNAAKTLMRYGVPLRRTAMGWELQYKEA